MSITALDAPRASEGPDGTLIALNHAAYVARGLNQLVDNYRNDADVLARAHEIIVQLQTDLKTVLGDVEYRLIQALDSRNHITLEDGSRVEYFKEPKEEWNDTKVRAALSLILAQHAIEVETGEVTFVVEHAERIVDIIFAVMSKTKPKKQALKAHRIDPATLYDTVWGPGKIRVVQPEPADVTPLRQTGEGEVR